MVYLAGGTELIAAPAFEGIVLNGQTEVVFQNPPVDGSTYNVLGYRSGTVTNPGNLTSSVRGTFGNDTSNSFLTFTAQLATRTWNINDGVWDAAATLTNWLEDDQVYRQQDAVVFPDMAASRTITLDGGLTPSTMTVENAANTYTFGGSGSLSGGFSFTKTGAGEVSFPNSSTRTGPSSLQGGTVRVGNDSSLGTGTITLDGGTLVSDSPTPRSLAASLVLAGNSTIGETSPGSGDFAFAGGMDLNGETNTLTLANAITSIPGVIGNGGLVKAGPGTLVSSGASTFTDGLNITAGEFSLNGTGSLADACAIEITAGATFRFARSASDTGFQNSISGSGTIIKTGTNEIGFTGTNTFSGQIDIQQGKIGLTGADSENGKPSVNIASGATFSLGSGFSAGTATIGNLSGAGNVDTAFGGSNDTRTLSITQTTDATFSGRLMNANSSRILAIRKEGAATLTLTGNTHTYTGTTSVNEGTLLVTGSLGNTVVTVASGATLGGNGNLGGPVTIQSGGTHALEVAAEPGLQATRSITGSLTLDPGNILTLTTAATPVNGTYILAVASGGITGTPGTVNLPAGVSDTVAVNGNNLELTVGAVSDYDSWKAGFSGFTNNAPAQDHDGDGLSNFEEYAFGLDPTKGSSVAPVTAPNKTTGTFTYTRRKQSLTGLDHTYQSSTTLGAWTAFAGPVSEVSNSGDPVETMTVTIPAALLVEPKLFLRVEAAKP